MVTGDPMEIWELKRSRADGKIKSLVTRTGEEINYDTARGNIEKGQIYLIGSEDGDNAKLIVRSDGTITTNRDGTELNNLTGATNLKITLID